MKFTLLTITALIISTFSMSVWAKVQAKKIEYKQGDTVLEGYLAYDDAKTKAPAVLIVHDWMGVGSYVKKRAEQLAKLGYVAFAADIYGKGVRPKNAKEAAATADIYKKDRALMRARAHAALDELKKTKPADPAKVAVIGYCFGGTTALELARSGADSAAVVSFHGGLNTPTPADAKNIKGKVLALHGAEDPFVPAEEVLAFEKEMKDGNVDYQLIAYGNTVHSFTNPEAGKDKSTGQAFNSVSDRRSWTAMMNLFDETINK